MATYYVQALVIVTDADIENAFEGDEPTNPAELVKIALVQGGVPAEQINRVELVAAR